MGKSMCKQWQVEYRFAQNSGNICFSEPLFIGKFSRLTKTNIKMGKKKQDR